MSGLRFDRLLASAAVALLLAAPPSARGQEMVPSQAGVLEAGRTPDPLAFLDLADRAIAESIGDLLAAKPNRIFADEKEHAAVEAFYHKRNLAPLWLDKGIGNVRAQAVIARLKHADADGLDPGDY